MLMEISIGRGLCGRASAYFEEERRRYTPPAELSLCLTILEFLVPLWVFCWSSIAGVCYFFAFTLFLSSLFGVSGRQHIFGAEFVLDDTFGGHGIAPTSHEQEAKQKCGLFIMSIHALEASIKCKVIKHADRATNSLVTVYKPSSVLCLNRRYSIWVSRPGYHKAKSTPSSSSPINHHSFRTTPLCPPHITLHNIPQTTTHTNTPLALIFADAAPHNAPCMHCSPSPTPGFSSPGSSGSSGSSGFCSPGSSSAGTLSCTFSVKAPITFPRGQYSQITYQPGAPPAESVQFLREQPTVVVVFQTSCVKWPVALL
jgi:hypothetical protein